MSFRAADVAAEQSGADYSMERRTSSREKLAALCVNSEATRSSAATLLK